MSKPIVRLTDIAVHGCWGPHTPASASPDVYINGIPALRQGDPYVPHCCPGDGCHGGNANGSNNVFINGKSAQKVDDPVTCGSVMIQGSGDVQIC